MVKIKKMEKNILLFVYGTLMSGFGNNILLRDQKLIGSGETINDYTMYVSGIPFVSDEKETSKIKGELWEVHPSRMHSIDNLEGHPDWYQRKIVPITVNGEEFQAWLYFNTDNRGRLIEDGDYRKYREEIANLKLFV